MIWHIVPTNDSEEHEDKSTCKCDPMVIMENNIIIVVHNSFDGRERTGEIMATVLNILDKKENQL